MPDLLLAALFVALAGAGAVLRAVTQSWCVVRNFPVGTILINVAGSFGAGIVVAYDEAVATVVGVALLGAMTTVSGFANDVWTLVGAKRWIAVAGYVVVTAVLGTGAATAGLAL